MLRRGDIVLVHYGFTNLATTLTDRVDRVIGLCQRNRCRRSTRALPSRLIWQESPSSAVKEPKESTNQVMRSRNSWQQASTGWNTAHHQINHPTNLQFNCRPRPESRPSMPNPRILAEICLRILRSDATFQVADQLRGRADTPGSTACSI